jgi:hypothetical protein
MRDVFSDAIALRVQGFLLMSELRTVPVSEALIIQRQLP